MNLEEHWAKALVLAPALVPVPRGRVCTTPAAAAAAASPLGAVVVKAQVPTGKRGKSGGIKTADSPAEAGQAAREILGMTIGGHRVERVLVESRAAIAREFYAAVLPDVASRAPLMLFSTAGGMDIEEVAALRPDAIRRMTVDRRRGFTETEARAMLAGLKLDGAAEAVAGILARLYRAFRENDAELLEINPLAELRDGSLVALDCKFVLDDAAAARQPRLAEAASRPRLTTLEQRGAAEGLRLIQLEGNVGVLANGAGLTMTTMDVIDHFGGHPANFLEIGGEAYTKGETALELVLANPGVKSLVVNFCGAFARTDVMTEGLVRAWEKLRPAVPAFFSVHGTGAGEAVQMLHDRLGIKPYDLMEDAVKAAVEAAR